MSTNFIPNGATTLINVTATSSSVTSVATGNQNSGYWLITNAGSTDCYFRLSTNPSVVATVPTIAGQANPGQMINSGDAYIVGVPVTDGGGYQQPGAFVANITVAANCFSFGTSTQLFVTPVLPIV